MRLVPSSHQTLFWLLAILLLLLTPAWSHAARSVSQFGITWTFDRDYQTGRFANGDHWVVGPVTITDISPASVVRDGDTLHGSMVNPAINGRQGYDSRIRENGYDSALNVALQLPLTLPAGSSLLSAVSHSAKQKEHNPQLKTIAILTVLEQPAPEGSFRPPPVGSDKTVRWNKSQLNFAALRSLPRVTSTPKLSTVEDYFERPWIEQKLDWTGRYLHPSDNQPAYGRELGQRLALGLLSLQLDYTPEQKETLLIRLVQYGIDIDGAARLGGRWNADGGHNLGRKMPLLLAAASLGDPELYRYADGTRHRIFQEDQQTWYVGPADVGRALHDDDGRPRDAYSEADIGLPEWGEKHATDPSRDGRNWSVSYRTVAGGALLGHVLAARLMGVEREWNWPALFDYADRYWKHERAAKPGPNAIPDFVRAVWSIDRPGSISNSRRDALSLGGSDARLVNLSSRARAETGEQVMIAGFVVAGEGPRRVLIRAIGDGLNEFGVSGTLRQPRLTLYRGAEKLYESNFSGAAGRDGPTATLAAKVAAYPFPVEAGDAAFAVTLEPGNYTAHVSGNHGAKGVTLVEIYDTGSGGDENSNSRLSNLSTRARVGGSHDVVIIGLVITGHAAQRVLLRAVGPALKSLGVRDALKDPELKLYREQVLIAENDNWSGDEKTAAAVAAVGAFALPADSRDAALVVELPPGSYTAKIEGRSGATGVALVEVFALQ